jgi:excisionase family DNA binding protein
MSQILQPAASPDVMTTAQAADYIGISKRTLYAWSAKRIGPDSIQVGRLVRYRKSDLDYWLSLNVRPSIANVMLERSR